MPGKEFAARLGWHASKVSRIELARQSASPADIGAWVDGAGGEPADRRALLGLLDQARESQHTFRQRLRHGQAPVQAGYNALMERSRHMRDFHTVLVPGMLQTPEYARAVLTAAERQAGAGTSDLEEAVRTRMERQRYLYTDRRFDFLICEPVLRWGIVPWDAMLVQIDRLRSVIDLPNVRLGLLPVSTPLPVLPLHMFEMRDDLVLVETISRELRYEGSEAATYAAVFESLWRYAVTGVQARDYLTRVSASRPPREPHVRPGQTRDDGPGGGSSPSRR